MGGDGERDVVTLHERLLGELREVGDGFELDVYLNWYRSLPLSSVDTLELTVDGEVVPRDEITFNGRSLDELAERWDEYWFVLDPATVHVRRAVRNEVQLRLGVRIPYLPITPTQPVVFVSECSRLLTVEESVA
jgi:hypothetical protein